MKYIELQYAFELEAANIDSIDEKISSHDILYWLNQGVYKFIKTRYNGNNFLRTSFEQDEKRARDLITLYNKQDFEDIQKETGVGYDIYSITYPEDLLFVLDESVIINSSEKPEEQRSVEIFECTLDNYMYRVTNSLTDFHYRNNYARPLRVRTKEGCLLLTDGNYGISKYSVGYLRRPAKITMENPYDEYTDMPEHTHNEIVKLAVQMYIENSQNKRYESINNEVSQME